MTETMACPKCGQVHARCKAHNRAGGPCMQRCRKAQKVCKTHGGSTPVALAAADRRMATAETLEAMAAYGSPVESADPSEAVMGMLRSTLGHVRFLEALVGRQGALGDDGKPSPAAELYERERDRGLRLSLGAHGMGISERTIRLAEQDAQLFAAGVLWLLARLARDDDEGRALAGEMFAALSAGTVPQEVGA